MNKLPDTLLDLPIRTDFKVWIAVEQMLQNPLNMMADTITDIINLVFIDTKPEDYFRAFSEITAFLGMYQEAEGADLTKEPLFDWEQDDIKVYSAFMRTYGINLRVASMHFWEFKALMQDLDEGCLLAHAMYYRGVDIRDFDGKQKDEIAKKKKHFEVK